MGRGLRRARPALLIAASLIAAGCDGTAASRTKAVAVVPAAPSIVFRAQELPFQYERGDTGNAWPVETTGGGVGMLDFDGDGDLDLFFAQGVPLPVGSSANPPADVLLRNDGAGRFVDVSAEAGLTSRGYGQGVEVGDYDGDGDPDVYITRYGPSTLWRNDGGRFVDATAEAGVAGSLWALGAAFADFDGDGDLDLFVANYFGFNPAEAPFDREAATGAPIYGMPSRFDGQPDSLYINDGHGHFADVTQTAGIAGKGRGMGVLAADLDGDGRMDAFVANDAMENALWRNRGDGTFVDMAMPWGCALNAEGQPEANMGIAHGDADGDGRADLFVSHFFNEHHTLWFARPVSDGMMYQDQTNEAGLGRDSRPLTGWGTVFADFDRDGRLDLVIANGHIRPEPSQPFPYANPPLLWRNSGKGRFANVSASAGPYFTSNHTARGLACGDLDGDGDLDLVVVHHHTPSVVLWNETPNPGHFLMIDLRGRAPNTTAIGARVTLTAGGVSQVRTVDGGGSYLSSGDRRVHFGLGDAAAVDRVEVRWPSGKVEARERLGRDSVVRWSEPSSTP